MFGSSLPSVVCRRANILFCLRIVVFNTYSVVFFCFFCLRLVACVPYVARGRYGRDHMVVGVTTTCAISADHH